jgi:hypothetical protein
MRTANGSPAKQAAERLTDVAYALMTGGLTLNGERQVTVPIADEIVLKRSETGAPVCGATGRDRGVVMAE